jgi:hypothetical protein
MTSLRGFNICLTVLRQAPNKMEDHNVAQALCNLMNVIQSF